VLRRTPPLLLRSARAPRTPGAARTADRAGRQGTGDRRRALVLRAAPRHLPADPASRNTPGMDVPENIFLVGFMGSGKSTVGQHLADVLGKAFLDCDRVLEERTGVDIPYIFDIEGEEGFRRREAAVVHELTEKRGIVLATGGGAVGSPENRRALATNGFVVYLHASAELLYQRTSRDRGRPMLHAEDPRARIDELLAVRDPLYRAVADLVIETGRRGSRRVVHDVVRAIAERAA